MILSARNHFVFPMLLLATAAALYGADAAALASQTLADNTQEAAGASFSQAWNITNTGTTTWGPGYSLQYVSGNAGCNHGTVNLSIAIAPNTGSIWSVNCIAPAAPGNYREDWKLVGPSGTIVVGSSSTIWVQVAVPTGTDAATFVSETLADSTQEVAGAAFSQTWTIKNTGTTTWGSTYSLQYVSGNAGCNHSSAALTLSVAPNASVNWTASCVAPSAPGTYREDWKMAGPTGTVLVGGYSTIWLQIVVPAAGGGDAASLVSETLADNTQEAAGANFTQMWTIKNAGTATWGAAYSLQYVSGNAGCNHNTSPLTVSIAPNTTVNWSMNCVAPAAPGTYREDWKLVGPSGAIAIGPGSTVWMQIVVPGGR